MTASLRRWPPPPTPTRRLRPPTLPQRRARSTRSLRDAWWSDRPWLRLEYDLSEHATVLEALQRGLRFRQRIPLRRRRSQPQADQLVQARGEQCGRARDLVEVLAPRDAHHADVAQQQPVDLQGGDGTRRETDHQQFAVDRQHPNGIVERRSAD